VRGKWGLVLLTLLLAVGPVVGGVVLLRDSGQGAATVRELSDRLAQAQAAALQAQQQAQAQAAQAQAPAAQADQALAQRLSDATAVEDLCSLLLTWSDHDSYEAMRSALVQDYGADPSGTLLTTTFAPDPTAVDAGGKRHSYMEAAGLNMAAGDVAVWPVGGDASGRRYAALAQFTSSQAGYASGSATALVTATVSGTGDAVRVSDVAAAFPPKA